MSNKTYNYVGEEKIVEYLGTYFARALEDAGYHKEVDIEGPGAPHIYEYRRDDIVATIEVDDTVGEKWEAELTVIAKGSPQELDEVVQAAVLSLLADVSKRLIESVVVESTRSAVATELSKIVAALA
jgi:hypothetical protein